MTLLPNPVGSTAKTSSSKQTILRMHSVCSSLNDLWMKSSRDEVRAAKNSLFTSPSTATIILKLHRKSKMQSCNQLERGSKNLLFFDQSDKSPESGLAADDSCSYCIRHCFFLPSPDRRLSRCHTFALPRKKERLIAGYFQFHMSKKTVKGDRAQYGGCENCVTTGSIITFHNCLAFLQQQITEL